MLCENTAALYCRLSKEDTAKVSYDESESIQNQRLILSEYAKKHCWTVYDCFIDEDYSGSDRDRPEFNRMLSLAQKHCFNIILCKTQSRFARDNKIVNEYVHEKFIEWKIRFVTVVDHIDTKDMLNKLNSNMIAVFDEYFLDTLSANIRSTLRRKKEDGQFTGSFAPYGYKKSPDNKNKLVPDEEAAAVVQMIFTETAAGKTYISIASKLNSLGIPTPKAYKLSKGFPVENMYRHNYGYDSKWSRDMVRSFLHNEVYIGNLIQGKTQVINFRTKTKINIPSENRIYRTGTHEPIIDINLWNTVQRITAIRRKGCSSQNNLRHPLSGRIFCGECGHKFYRCKSGGIEYFACGYARNVRDGLCTNNSRIRIDLLEYHLKKQINKVIDLYCDMELFKKGLLSVQPQNNRADFLQNQLSALNSQLQKEKTMLMNLYEDKLSGKILPEIFDTLQQKFIEKQNQLNAKLTNTQNELSALKSNDNENFSSPFDTFFPITSISLPIIDELIDSIIVFPPDTDTLTRNITINFDI